MKGAADRQSIAIAINYFHCASRHERRVMITRFLYKWQDTVQMRRRGPSLPCSAPNLTSQINQTKGEERSTNPEKIGACSDLQHPFVFSNSRFLRLPH